MFNLAQRHTYGQIRLFQLFQWQKPTHTHHKFCARAMFGVLYSLNILFFLCLFLLLFAIFF